MSIIHRILNVFGSEKPAAEPNDAVRRAPAVQSDTPAWLDISSVNRASNESGQHLEQMRKARCEAMKRPSY